jgi:hypothetical protein
MSVTRRRPLSRKKLTFIEIFSFRIRQAEMDERTRSLMLRVEVRKDNE